jgi:hypothetical protein
LLFFAEIPSRRTTSRILFRSLMSTSRTDNRERVFFAAAFRTDSSATITLLELGVAPNRRATSLAVHDILVLLASSNIAEDSTFTKSSPWSSA